MTLECTLVDLATGWVEGRYNDSEVQEWSKTHYVWYPWGLEISPMYEPEILWSCGDGNAWADVRWALMDDLNIHKLHDIPHSKYSEFCKLVNQPTESIDYYQKVIKKLVREGKMVDYSVPESGKLY